MGKETGRREAGIGEVEGGVVRVGVDDRPGVSRRKPVVCVLLLGDLEAEET